ncbi:MAG: NADH-ubiquinone oxidoreductase-F iron-sulfur binding region domain-containing protein [Salinigranum sp.]
MAKTNDSAVEPPVVRVAAASDPGASAPDLASAAREAASASTVLEVGPTGVAALDPLVLLTRGGRTAFHPNASAAAVRDLVAGLEDGDLGDDVAAAVVDHDPDAGGLPRPDEGPLSVGVRRVLGRCGWVDPADAAALPAFVADAASENPASIRDRVADLGLLGRGRGDGRTDEPVARAWDLARETDGDPVVAVNANEADRSNDTDRTLLAGDAAAVVDASLAVASVVDATDVVVYCNDGDERTARVARAAAASVVEALDPGPSIQVVAGPDRFVAGETTMALEAMEGNDRLEARIRPPSPAEHGLHGRPTVVHTPRTLAQVRAALVSPERFDPDDADPGTRLFTVSGDVDAPATVELPTGSSLAALREAVALEGAFKMACVGGQFGGLTRSLDQVASAPALAGADLGTEGAVELLNRERCVVAAVGRRARFARDENCGRCVPCREGSTQLHRLLRAIYDGAYDRNALEELTRVMGATSTCEFGRAAARPVATAVDEFETEFRAHADGRCPAGECVPGRAPRT